jgi:predicted adenylyl cyclase CyaB
MLLYETEIKIRLDSEARLSSTITLCTNLYGDGENLLQVDEYFDTPEEHLKTEDLTLRLRTINGIVRVAMKSSRERITEAMHKRIELEFTAADAREVREQIVRQGLITTAIYEKQRWRFKTDDSKIVVDRLPFIGTFVEVEAASPRRINNVLNLLRLSINDAVSDNYTELLEAKFKELGLPLRPNLRATFEAEAQWLSQQQ